MKSSIITRPTRREAFLLVAILAVTLLVAVQDLFPQIGFGVSGSDPEASSPETPAMPAFGKGWEHGSVRIRVSRTRKLFPSVKFYAMIPAACSAVRDRRIGL